MLIPKKFRYNVAQKKRKIKKFVFSSLKFGDFGLKTLNNFKLTNHHIFRLKLLFKKATKRSDKTLRYYWISLFPNQPFTLKAQGLRMGKGKGKRKRWFIHIKCGIIFIEFLNLRFGRNIYYLRQIIKRLGVKFIYLSYFSQLKKNKNINYLFLNKNLFV